MPEGSQSRPGDAEILGRLRDGDASAFDDLVRAYQKDVYRLAYRITGSPQEADDVAQETFLRAYGALPRFRGDAALRTWLLRIAANLSLNVVASARVARREEGDPEDRAPAAGPEGESAVLEAERMRRVRRAAMELPPRQRAALALRVESGLKFKEIARTMGCTTGTAKAHFFHAVAALRKALEDLI